MIVAGSETSRPSAIRQLIESYGAGGFKVSGKRHSGSVLIFREETVAWPVTSAAGISTEALQPILRRAAETRILVIGCGGTLVPRPIDLATTLRSAGISLEWMATGAACRTYNVLLLEDREVAAALISIE